MADLAENLIVGGVSHPIIPSSSLTNTQKIQALNNIGIEYIFKDQNSASTLNTWVYTGVSFTVPENKIGITTASIGFSNVSPKSVAISRSSTSLGTNAFKASTIIEDALCGAVYATQILKSGTYYVWGKWAGTHSVAGPTIVSCILINK